MHRVRNGLILFKAVLVTVSCQISQVFFCIYDCTNDLERLPFLKNYGRFHLYLTLVTVSTILQNWTLYFIYNFLSILSQETIYFFPQIVGQLFKLHLWKILNFLPLIWTKLLTINHICICNDVAGEEKCFFSCLKFSNWVL